MAGQFDFNAAFKSSAVIMPIPVQRPWAQRRPGSHPHRSNSASHADHLASRRALGHSRTSSGSHSSRETSLQTDRPAAAAPDTAAAAGQNPVADSVASSSLASRAKSPSSMNRPQPAAQDVRASDMNPHAASAESVSSASGTASLSARTTMTSGPYTSSSRDTPLAPRPFVQRNGRTYLSNPELPYPLPVDLTELHRQSLRTLLLIQLFGAPVCSPSLTKNPPRRVLEVGCGSGFWSMMCHRYYKGRGHGGISFTGIDVAPLSPTSTDAAADAPNPDTDMSWKFYSHDIRVTPWPLPEEEQFDLIMAKDMSLAVVSLHQPSSQEIFNEYLRLLKPGGALEIWESDHLIRMLRPYAPGTMPTGDADELEVASSLGAYVLSANTPLSAPLNSFLIDYNTWLTRALEESDLVDVRSRRLAIPLSEVRWERAEAKNQQATSPKQEQRALSSGQSALRATALLTVVEQVQALEPVLREASGKSQDEWDVWLGKMMGDLMGDSGASWGECLEVGAWWATKKVSGGEKE
ncbi:methyltransferase domain-containing protein [Hirsutella rhossiliensis]|uniref:Methyltransferase domain-containing protein n=1 Tax=Hirsutella rhossiliensis TaxID=111463 RepID=A0A9P8MX49_9HYPO|nr:methyltransferase domain-containing protein [Hirsutella rhossiliensis]KAH0963703.1 methyltransferase domain-containing protein [Hirsutella rhossiliensis]